MKRIVLSVVGVFVAWGLAGCSVIEIFEGASPVETPTHLPTPEPTAVPTIDPYPKYEEIKAENASLLSTIELLGDGAISDVAVSPDQTKLVVYTATGLYLYDRQTFDQIAYSDDYISPHGAVGFGPDGEIYFTQENRMWRWDYIAENDEDMVVFFLRSDIQGLFIDGFEFTADGQHVIVTTTDGRGFQEEQLNIALYKTTGRRLKLYDAYVNAWDLPEYYLVDGHMYLLSGSRVAPNYPHYPTYITVIEIETGQISEMGYKPASSNSSHHDLERVTPLTQLQSELLHVFRQDEQNGRLPFLARCGWEMRVLYADEATAIFQKGNRIEQWDTINCELANVLNYSAAQQIEFDPSGRFLAAQFDDQVTVWDLTTAEIAFSVADVDYSSFEFNGDGGRLFTSESREMVRGEDGIVNFTSPLPPLEIWDTSSGQIVGEIPPVLGSFSRIYATYKPEIIITHHLPGFAIWNIETGALLYRLDMDTHVPFVVDQHRNGVWVAARDFEFGKETYQLRLIDLDTGEVKQEMAPRSGLLDRIQANFACPEIFVFEYGGVTRAIDVGTEAVLWEREDPFVRSMHISPAGEAYAKGDEYPNSYRTWLRFFNGTIEPPTKIPGDALIASNENVWVIENNHTLESARYDQMYELWIKEDGFNGNLAHYIPARHLVDVDVSPDNHFLALVRDDGRIELRAIAAENR